eukprot:scaffold16733_cov112-Isochrysis_galbana.AAC.10
MASRRVAHHTLPGAARRASRGSSRGGAPFCVATRGGAQIVHDLSARRPPPCPPHLHMPAAVRAGSCNSACRRGYVGSAKSRSSIGTYTSSGGNAQY